MIRWLFSFFCLTNFHYFRFMSLSSLTKWQELTMFRFEKALICLCPTFLINHIASSHSSWSSNGPHQDDPFTSCSRLSSSKKGTSSPQTVPAPKYRGNSSKKKIRPGMIVSFVSIFNSCTGFWSLSRSGGFSGSSPLLLMMPLSCTSMSSSRVLSSTSSSSGTGGESGCCCLEGPAGVLFHYFCRIYIPFLMLSLVTFDRVPDMFFQL